MQDEILAQDAAPDVRVYAVWFNMLLGDHRVRWDGAGLTDARVAHFWDEHKLVGTWYAQAESFQGVVWDVYYLYAPGVGWGAPPVSRGGTVLARGPQLRAALLAQLGTSGPGSPPVAAIGKRPSR